MTNRILVVDDEENICFTLKRFLEDEGYEVFVAKGYSEAIAALLAHDFDLIFTFEQGQIRVCTGGLLWLDSFFCGRLLWLAGLLRRHRSDRRLIVIAAGRIAATGRPNELRRQVVGPSRIIAEVRGAEEKELAECDGNATE